MKQKLCFFLALLAIAVSSYTTNSTNQTGDKTLSPLSGGSTCISCHTTGATRPLSIMYAVRTGSTVIVDSFIAGEEYTINISSAQPTALFPKFGYQACVLDGANANAGTINAATTGSALATLNSVNYLEHAAPLTTVGATARVQFTWTAPNMAQSVSVYGVILHSNNFGNVNGDICSHPEKLTLRPAATNGLGLTATQGLTDRIRIFPNPATDHVDIGLDGIGGEEASITVSDLLGRQLYRSSISIRSSPVNVPLEGFVAGTYFLTIQAGGRSGTKPFIVK